MAFNLRYHLATTPNLVMDCWGWAGHSMLVQVLVVVVQQMHRMALPKRLPSMLQQIDYALMVSVLLLYLVHMGSAAPNIVRKWIPSLRSFKAGTLMQAQQVLLRFARMAALPTMAARPIVDLCQAV